MESRQDTFERTSGSTGNVTNRFREVGKQSIDEVKEVLSRIAPSTGYGIRLCRALLLIESILFGFFGIFAIAFPISFLEYHRLYADFMNWGAPSPLSASSSLRLYVQMSGSLAASLAVFSLSSLVLTDTQSFLNLARINIISKFSLGIMLLFIAFGRHKNTFMPTSSSLFKGVLPLALYCLIEAVLIIFSSGSIYWMRNRLNRTVNPGLPAAAKIRTN